MQSEQQRWLSHLFMYQMWICGFVFSCCDGWIGFSMIGRRRRLRQTGSIRFKHNEYFLLLILWTHFADNRVIFWYRLSIYLQNVLKVLKVKNTHCAVKWCMSVSYLLYLFIYRDNAASSLFQSYRPKLIHICSPYMLILD